MEADDFFTAPGGLGGICQLFTYNRRLKAKARSLRAHPTDAELYL
jgi:hypothetical protein